MEIPALFELFFFHYVVYFEQCSGYAEQCTLEHERKTVMIFLFWLSYTAIQLMLYPRFELAIRLYAAYEAGDQYI